MRETWRRIALLVGTAFRTSPGRCLAALLGPVSAIVSTLGMVAVATLVNGIVDGDRLTALVSAALVAGAFPVASVLTLIARNSSVALTEGIGFAFDRQIAEIVATIPSLEHHERADVADQLQILRSSRGALGDALDQIIAVLHTIVQMAAILIALGVVEPRLLVLLALAVPAILGGRLRFGWRRDGENASAAPGRLARHLTAVATSPQPGMELRVFGLREEIRRRLWRANRAWRLPYAHAEFLCMLSTLVEDALFALALAAMLGWLLYEAVHGRVAIGTLVLAAYGATTIQVQVVAAARMFGSLSDSLRAAGRLLWLRDTADDLGSGYSGDKHPPATLQSGLRLDGVSFRYPGGESWALREVSLDLAAGSVVALVGENGAGKSTLVKLLLGMYRPTEGTITVDGLDMADLDVAAWRARTGGAFQDFARFELLARQTVGVGDLDRVDDDLAVRAAMRDAGGADVVDALPYGLNTPLGATWDNGVDLSGGQWQKLALGRGLMRAAPLLQVFDEPTASLDATTEHALFERYTAAAREGRARGAVTLLVTHRFSTVRAADLIVVLRDGRIAEAGSHADLVRAGGAYAELYELQARGYR